LRAADVVAAVEAGRDAPCHACGSVLCGHEVVMNLVAGNSSRPLCVPCLTAHLQRETGEFLGQLRALVARTECYAAGWRHADQDERARRSSAACRVAAFGACAAAPQPGPPVTDGEPAADERWDAGDMSCGELVLELKLRLTGLAPGSVLAVRATDAGAAQDLPAWCRLAGHRLVLARGEMYWIRRRGAAATPAERTTREKE
jgi:tRNA 2-thiouridine synthesizing protein A